MVFHPSHRPLEIAHAIPTVPQPQRRRSSLTNKQNKGTLLSSYGRGQLGGHFYVRHLTRWRDSVTVRPFFALWYTGLCTSGVVNFVLDYAALVCYVEHG